MIGIISSTIIYTLYISKTLGTDIYICNILSFLNMQNTNKVQKIFKKNKKKKQGLFCMLPFIIFPQNNSTSPEENVLWEACRLQREV